MSVVAQITEPGRMDNWVVLLNVNLEVLLQKLPVIFTAIGCLICFLEFFQTITANSAQVCEILNVHFVDLAAFRHCLSSMLAVLNESRSLELSNSEKWGF